MPIHVYVIQKGEVEKVVDCIPPLVTIYRKGEVINEVSCYYF